MTDQSKKLSQEELRKLMREKSAANKTRITSTYAKYNTLDQLTCSLCCTVVKTEKLWNAHLLSRTHKENLVKPNLPPKMPTKRSIENDPAVKSPKKFKSGVVPITNKDGQQLNGGSSHIEKKIHLADYDSSDEDEDEKDKKVGEGSSTSSDSTAAKKNNINASLPVGFFDDPKLDAKARNVPFKDKMEEELAKFQKEIREETEISETMVEEDYEEKRLDKEIEEIDEQMGYWKRLYDIIQKAKSTTEVPKKAKEEKKVQEKEESDDDDDDDIDIADDLENLNWRRKFL